MTTQGWLDRTFGPGDERSRTQTSGAVGCGLAAVGLAIAAELTPWATMTGGLPRGVEVEDFVGAELYLASAGTWTTLIYGIGWMGLFALAATAIVTRSRPLTAAAVGWAAGEVVMLAGLIGAISRGDSLIGGRPPRSVEYTIGIGAYAAMAAVLLAVTAVIIAQWRPRGPRTGKEAEADLEAGPVDLTVTQVTAAHVER